MAWEERKITAGAECPSVRTDRFLSDETGMSRSHVQKLISGGYVRLNGEILTGNKTLVKPGDEFVINEPEPESIDLIPEDIPLDIVYEDGDVLIVNKPKDMVVHPAPGHSSGTLVNALMHHLGDNLSGINGELRPGIVHRIDKDTTGLLVICKNDNAHIKLSSDLSVHDITRVYYCLAHGRFKEKEGRVDAPIGRHPTERKKMAIVKNGRRAVTNYRVLFEFDRDYSLVECRLETGRTHQIRVHLSSLGHPLVGDEVYGRKKETVKAEGQVLHAAVLGFRHPSTGEYMEFKAPLPAEFVGVLYKLCRNAEEKEMLEEALRTNEIEF